jgi:hypothetical protein
MSGATVDTAKILIAHRLQFVLGPLSKLEFNGDFQRAAPHTPCAGSLPLSRHCLRPQPHPPAGAVSLATRRSKAGHQWKQRPQAKYAWRALRSIRKLQSAGTVTYARVARRFMGGWRLPPWRGSYFFGPGCYRLTAPSNIVWRNRWRAPRPAVISMPEWHTARIPRAAGTGLVLNVTSWTISGLTVFLAIVAVWLIGI